MEILVLMEVLTHLALQRHVKGLRAFIKPGPRAWKGTGAGTMGATLTLLLGLQALATLGEHGLLGVLGVG